MSAIYGECKVDGLASQDYTPAGFRSWQLRQEVNPVGEGDFGQLRFGNVQSRVAFVNFPEKWDETMIGAAIKNARINRVYSNSPILQNFHKKAVLDGKVSEEELYEKLADKQLVRDGKTKDAILFHGREQYKIEILRAGDQEDIDYRDHADTNVVTESAVDAVMADNQMM